MPLSPITSLPGQLGIRTCLEPYRLDFSGQGYDNFGPCQVFGATPPLGSENRICNVGYFVKPSPSGDVYYDDQGYCKPQIVVQAPMGTSSWIWIGMIVLGGVAVYLLWHYRKKIL